MQRQFRIVAGKGHKPEEAFETIIVSRGTVIDTVYPLIFFLSPLSASLPSLIDAMLTITACQSMYSHANKRAQY